MLPSICVTFCVTFSHNCVLMSGFSSFSDISVLIYIVIIKICTFTTSCTFTSYYIWGSNKYLCIYIYLFIRKYRIKNSLNILWLIFLLLLTHFTFSTTIFVHIKQKLWPYLLHAMSCYALHATTCMLLKWSISWNSFHTLSYTIYKHGLLWVKRDAYHNSFVIGLLNIEILLWSYIIPCSMSL